MELMYKTQKPFTYEDYTGKVAQSILFDKTKDHEKRISDTEERISDLFKVVTNFESRMNNLHEEFISFNDFMTNDNRLSPNKQNTKSDNNAKYSRLETIVSELNEVEDKKLQVQIVGELVDEIKGMLKDIPKQKNNYRRNVLLMFHEALKQNYTKNLFSESQVKALTEVARVCNETFVTKEQYFKMDDILCDCNLDMMPDLE